MKIATWNVNSIKARLEVVQKWMDINKPDLLLIQELKGQDFPSSAFDSLGYKSTCVTQKTYNGVAMLSKTPLNLIYDKLPGFEEDKQARYLECCLNDIHFINIYLPNGNPVDSEKFPYKLKWMEALYKHLASLREKNVPFAIGGDFNIIPAEKDCYAPDQWKGDALFHPDSLKIYRKILHLGLTDAFRIYNNTNRQYTFWDYQAGAWPQDKGLRIDHFLLSPDIADCLVNCVIDKEPRGWEKPSDHTPLIMELAK